MKKSIWARYAAILALVGCAGTQRSCSSSCAETYGADWVIVKTTMDGVPFRCWQLEGVSVANEGASDGIYWKSEDGHLVHIQGNYERVQVERGDWKGALAQVGLTPERCQELQVGGVK